MTCHGCGAPILDAAIVPLTIRQAIERTSPKNEVYHLGCARQAVREIPGVRLLWSTAHVRRVYGSDGGRAGLRVGAPATLEWRRGDRAATRAEVDAAIARAVLKLRAAAAAGYEAAGAFLFERAPFR